MWSLLINLARKNLNYHYFVRLGKLMENAIVLLECFYFFMYVDLFLYEKNKLSLMKWILFCLDNMSFYSTIYISTFYSIFCTMFKYVLDRSDYFSFIDKCLSLDYVPMSSYGVYTSISSWHASSMCL